MNPKSTANLDPKLREAYERIMGTTVPASPKPSEAISSTATNPSATPAQAATPAPIDHSPLPEPAAPQPVEPVAPQLNNQPQLQVQEVPPEPITIQTPPQMPFPPQQEPKLNEMVQSPQMPDMNNKSSFTSKAFSQIDTTNLATSPSSSPIKKKNKLMPILISVGGIGFFILYAVIWAKIFTLF
jgi:hypothetical protein